MTKTKHKILSVFLSFCMIISCMVGMSVTASAEPIAIGDTGLTWEFDNGTLTISGMGAIPDYSFSGGSTTAPWKEYLSSIENIVINAGVTSIGVNAFYNCSALKSVTIPVGVTSIGKASFNGCTVLANVTLPSGLKSIGDYAFANCKAISSITIPESVISIGKKAFQTCMALESVIFTPGTAGTQLVIGENAFFQSKADATVAYGDGNTKLYNGTTEIKAGDALTKIYSTNDNETKTLKWTAKSTHTHSFTYSTSGATITATCSVAECPLNDSKATLTLVKPTLTTYGETGKSAAATLTGLEAFNAATGLNVGATNIKYYKAEEIFPGYKRAGDELAQAPTGVGDYFVGLTLSNVKISESETEDVKVYVPYTIAKGTPTITTAPTASDITYGQQLSDSTLSGGAASVDGTFEWKTPTTAPAVSDSDTTEYTVVFTPTDSTNYSAVETTVKLTVSKADPVYTTPTGLTATYGQTLANVTLPTADNGTWSWQDDPATTGVGDITVGEPRNFLAKFTPNDTDNYNIIEDVNIQITVTPAAASVAIAPTANTLTYTGSAQALVTAGTGTNGTMQYSTTETGTYSTDIPTGTDAGSYTVWYKVVGDTGYSDTTPASIAVTIAKAASSVTSAPTAKTGLTATGSALALVNAGTAEGGEMQYSLDGVTYSADIPTATAAGTYTVYYKVVGDKNHTDAEAQTLTVTVSAASAPVNPPIYVPTNISTNTTTTTTTTTTETTPDITKYTITGEQDELNESALAWDAIPNASGYALYIKADGKYVFVQDLGKATNADIVLGSNGKYYVSTGGDYTIYEYNEKTGKLDKTGTLKASKIENIVKANNVTENFMVKYTINGKESAEKDSYKVSVKIYYKPAVKITANKGSITLKWNKVPEATKYRVYKYVNGKLKLVTETTKRSVKINGTKAGKEYTYAVKAYVNGKWTKVYASDLVSVTAK